MGILKTNSSPGGGRLSEPNLILDFWALARYTTGISTTTSMDDYTDKEYWQATRTSETLATTITLTAQKAHKLLQIGPRKFATRKEAGGGITYYPIGTEFIIKEVLPGDTIKVNLQVSPYDTIFTGYELIGFLLE